MANTNIGDVVFSTHEMELAKKYFGKYLSENVIEMERLFKSCNIPNISREDCEDMYNEFFTIAVRTYDTSKSRFRYYLRRVVRNKSLTVIRRVISQRDPLFYALSLDITLDNGAMVEEAVGYCDNGIASLADTLTSPESVFYELSPFDKVLLFYRGCGYTLREISERLGISLSTVQRRIERQKKNKKLLNSIKTLK